MPYDEVEIKVFKLNNKALPLKLKVNNNVQKVRKIPVIEIPKFSLENELKEEKEIDSYILKKLNDEESLPYDEIE